MLEERVRAITQKISKAKALVHREDAVRFIGVTKYVDTKKARELVEVGVKDLAENRTDLFLEKYHALSDLEVTWHLIGTLQRRKVKDVINLIDYFHALDSLKLAEEINKRAEKEILTFVQVNVSGEASKHGISAEELLDFIEQLKKFESIKVVGLMTLAPIEATEPQLRNYFSKLRKCRDTVQRLGLVHAPCTELSMGMSRDYQIAVEEGATYVRIGSELFR
ncbi:MAG: YggS family pyridoxal phosphate-dependent enzyme [Streptococcaceae bacterium]|nr:YggS family pyridoxal phosphate-dependent enzyme [Streptococcaceae bacterium]